MKWFYNLTDKARGLTIAASWIPFFLLIVTIDFSNNVLVIIAFLALIPAIFLSALVIVEALKAKIPKIKAAIEEDRKRKQETREMQEQLRQTQENIRDMMVRLEKLREKTLAEEKARECSPEEPKE